MRAEALLALGDAAGAAAHIDEVRAMQNAGLLPVDPDTSTRRLGSTLRVRSLRTAPLGEALVDLLDAWLDGRPRATASAYRRDASSLLQHAGKAPLDMTADDVAAWRPLARGGRPACGLGRPQACRRAQLL